MGSRINASCWLAAISGLAIGFPCSAQQSDTPPTDMPAPPAQPAPPADNAPKDAEAQPHIAKVAADAEAKARADKAKADAAAKVDPLAALAAGMKRDPVDLKVTAAADEPGKAEWRKVWIGQTVVVDRWRKINPSDEITSVIEIRTAAGPEADVALSVDGGVGVTIDRLSRVRISRMRAGEEADAPTRLVIELARGRVTVTPAPTSAGKPAPAVSVVTPDALIVVQEPTEISYEPAVGTKSRATTTSAFTPPVKP